MRCNLHGQESVFESKIKTYGLSQSQLGIYSEYIQYPDLLQYNYPCYFKFPNTINKYKLKSAIELVLNTYPIFRNRLIEQGEELRQYSDPDFYIEVLVEDVNEEVVKDRLKEFIRPFDLNKDIFTRFLLLATSDNLYLTHDIHHIIMDGKTTDVIYHLIELAYQDKELPSEAMSFYEYAEHEIKSFETAEYKLSSGYYKEKFQGLGMTKMPGELNTTPGTLHQISSYISKSYIDTACELHGIKPSWLFMSAFEIVLSRFSREKDVIYSTALHGRNHKFLRNTLGMFVKTAPVLAHVDDEIKVIDYIHSHKLELDSIRSHDIFPFTHFCAKLGITPEITFGFQGSFIKDDIHFLNEDVVRVPMFERACSQKPVVVVYDIQTKYEVRIQYIDCQYSALSIQQFADAIVVCVEQMLLSLESCLKDLSILSSKECKDLKLLGQGKELSYDSSVSIIGLFQKQVLTRPEMIAVVYEDRQYSYREIDDLSTVLALYLRDNGICREQVVGVMIDRSEWMVIYPLSILKAGGAYMPLDGSLPSDRLLYMLEEAEVSLILSEGDLVSSIIPDFKGDIILTTDVLSLPKTEIVLDCNSSATDMCVILYTSGSTGRPKGCILEHGNLLNFSHWYINEFNISTSDKGIAYANFSFDAHIIDLYPLLFCGGCVHIIPSWMRMDMAMLNTYIEENTISIAFLTTQIGAQIVSMFENHSLRLLSVGGEQLPSLKKPPYHFFNIYGPTECTIGSSFYEVKKDFDNKLIGRPIANYQLYVVDQTLHMVPQGVAGELCVGGAGVSRGYLNRPDLTSEKFIELNGHRIYRTGDLVRWNKEGELEYLGRIDNQVKLRSLRIELGEIESVMSRYEGIQQAIVDVKELGGLQYLCGYYTSNEMIEEYDLRKYLLLSLANYMVPMNFMKLESFPLTPNGKVNRKILPVPEIKQDEIVIAETPLEQSLFDITKNFLGIETFGVTTNLISMGLTSMGAIKLSLLIQKEMGLKLKTKDILSNPTIRKWTNHIQKEDEQIRVYDKLDYYPLTGNQLGIYLDWEKNRESLQYNIPLVLKLTDVNSILLHKALETVLEAHPYLKVQLEMRNGEIVQIRYDERPISILINELDIEPGPDFFQQCVRPFNLIKNQLFRIEIYTVDQKTYLFIDIHHIIYDGGSVDILLDDLVKSYKGVEIQQETFSAYEYALEYKNWLSSEAYIESEAYFDELVDDVESVLYPLSATIEEDGKSKELILSFPRLAVQDICKKIGVTENCFFITSFMQILHRLTSEDHLMITTLSNGRSSTNISETVGMFVQTLPVVSHFADHTIAEAMVIMQQQLLETINKDQYPFSHLADRHELKPNIMIAYQGGVIDESLYFNEKPAEMLKLNLTTAKVPISVDISPLRDTYQLTLEYDSRMYSKEDMLLLAKSFQSFVASITKHSALQKISKIPLLSDFECRELIHLGNGGEISYDLAETFVDVFKKQVKLYPDKIAVVDEIGSITYSELDRMSDTLASVLVSKGVSTDEFVSLMLPRCKEFMVCFLAVFKAGGAYIPLDSDYPNDRLLYMLQDSKAKVLLTTSSLFTEKQKSGDFTVENILFVDGFDFHHWKGSINNSRPSSLAYMIYTSGSTGQPKGVMIEHKSLRAFVAWFSHCIGLKSDDRCAQHASFSFDASMDDLMTPLSVGGEIHILSSVLRHDMEGMYHYFKEHNITGISVSTQLGMEMLNQYELPLRFVVVGGEKLKPIKATSTKVINTYGPTEFTVSATYYIIDPQQKYQNIPIGRPVPNSISVIVDKSGNLLPHGVAGELCLIGRQISRGYWGKADLTFEKFVPCPFFNGEKMYRTGDLARWNTEGKLEYLGRIDNQVKLRGFRIELGEIETALLRYEGIQDAIVEVKEIGETQHLCAYYTSNDSIEKDNLRKYLLASLTDYMVPTAFMHIESLPLTPNGKVNRKALPAPEIERAVKYEAPTHKIEEDICSVFKKLLKLNEVGIHDNFFEIGGTSIIAIKAVIQITNLNYQINYGDLFKLKTPRSIAQFLDPNIKIMEESTSDNRFDFSTYNYDEIEQLLSKNDHDLWNNFDLRSLGGVLLTGATGYLGIHLLHHLLMNDHNEIYCLVRSKSKVTPENRLKALMTYYFSDDWISHFDARVKIIEGDITDDNLIEKLKTENIDTIFNCAAMVKHYIAEDTMEVINVHGVSNLISLSIEKNAYLIHISTYSIGGTAKGDGQKSLSEQDFYIGQVTDNEYIRTKFYAERLVLQAIMDRGLKAKIMRVGNLMGRASDGEFQINFNSNAFVNSLKSYKILGVFPLDEMTNSIEISPIDKTAEAVAKLASTPQDMIIFHPYNNYQIDMAAIVKSFNDYGYKIDVVSNNIFSAHILEMMGNADKAEYLQGLIHFGKLNEGLSIVEPVNNYTTSILYRLGFYWNQPNANYIYTLIGMLDGLGFFDDYKLMKGKEKRHLSFIK